MPPALIVVTGAPGSGKSTVAVPAGGALAAAADRQGRAQGGALGASRARRPRPLSPVRACDLPPHALDRGSRPALGRVGDARGELRPDWAAEELAGLQAQTPFRFVQILCRADPDTCLARYRERAETDARHAMHRVGGAESEASVERGLREGVWERPIPLDGKLFTVDTKEPVDVDALADAVASVLTEA